jgi:hypothetical protein
MNVERVPIVDLAQIDAERTRPKSTKPVALGLLSGARAWHRRVADRRGTPPDARVLRAAREAKRALARSERNPWGYYDRS